MKIKTANKKIEKQDAFLTRFAPGNHDVEDSLLENMRGLMNSFIEEKGFYTRTLNPNHMIFEPELWQRGGDELLQKSGWVRLLSLLSPNRAEEFRLDCLQKKATGKEHTVKFTQGEFELLKAALEVMRQSYSPAAGNGMHL